MGVKGTFEPQARRSPGMTPRSVQMLRSGSDARPTKARWLIIAACLCLGPRTPLQAAPGDTWLDVNLASRHSEKSYFWKGRIEEYNANNFGLGLTRELAGWCEVKGGWFENSYEKTSLYALVAVRHDLLQSRRWVLAPGVAGGLVTGYQNTPEQTGEVAPWGLAVLTLGWNDRIRAHVGYLPSKLFNVGTVDFLTLQLSWKL